MLNEFTTWLNRFNGFLYAWLYRLLGQELLVSWWQYSTVSLLEVVGLRAGGAMVPEGYFEENMYLTVKFYPKAINCCLCDQKMSSTYLIVLESGMFLPVALPSGLRMVHVLVLGVLVLVLLGEHYF